jgi:hypothetical protein
VERGLTGVGRPEPVHFDGDAKHLPVGQHVLRGLEHLEVRPIDVHLEEVDGRELLVADDLLHTDDRGEIGQTHCSRLVAVLLLAGQVPSGNATPDVGVGPAGCLGSAALNGGMRIGQADEPRVVANVREGLARLSLLAGVDVGVVAVRDQRGAERAPGARDAARATDVHEHERMTVEHPSPPQDVRHRRVQDQTLYTTLRD